MVQSCFGVVEQALHQHDTHTTRWHWVDGSRVPGIDPERPWRMRIEEQSLNRARDGTKTTVRVTGGERRSAALHELAPLARHEERAKPWRALARPPTHLAKRSRARSRPRQRTLLSAWPARARRAARWLDRRGVSDWASRKCRARQRDVDQMEPVHVEYLTGKGGAIGRFCLKLSMMLLSWRVATRADHSCPVATGGGDIRAPGCSLGRSQDTMQEARMYLL
mmetsp:Transcript_14521/g.37648  ORF Transcript_14521/g.37648 Transcript_14521/m.37648 type:complete len:222 (-) Transcript_14521:936-1601(-)